MKYRSIACAVSILVLGGCAGTGGGKPSGKESSAGPAKAVTAKDVTDRYAKLIYGKTGNRKNPTTMKGTLSIEQFNIEGPVTVYSMAPDSNVTLIEVMGTTLNSGCHKGTCWAQQPGAGTTTLTGDAAALQLQQADYQQWNHTDRYYTSMEIVNPAAGTESTTYQIKAVKKNGDTDYYNFSKESGLLESAVVEGETVQGRMKISLQFKDYKDFEGEMYPTKLMQSVAQGTFTLTFTDVSHAPLTEDKFAKP